MRVKAKNEKPERRKKPRPSKTSEPKPTESQADDASVREFEQALREAQELTYVLRLYVTGVTPALPAGHRKHTQAL